MTTTTTTPETAILKLRYAALEVNERALLAFYTSDPYFLDDLAHEVERLQERIDAYREACRSAPQDTDAETR